MPTPVFFMHDGAVDELICIPLLASMSPAVDLTGIWITPADCIGYPTALACQKMLSFSGCPQLPLYLTDTSSQRPFPWEYRQYSLMVNLLPYLNQPAVTRSSSRFPVSKWFSEISEENERINPVGFRDYIKDRNDRAGHAMVLLITCPLTDINNLLNEIPDLKKEIDSIVWMGGSLKAGGNIDTGLAPGANPNAEWNAYWDPYAVRSMFSSGIPFYLFPLDVTNQVFLTPQILQQFFLPFCTDSKMIDLAAQMYALVAFQGGYSFWDTVTAAFLGNPGLFTTSPQKLDINIDDQSPDFGNISVSTNGFTIQVAQSINVSGFYEYLTSQLKKIN